MGQFIPLLGMAIPLLALSIPIIAIVSSSKQKMQLNRIKELELKKEILELEVKSQNGKIRLLEEESRKLDREINR
jgi:hypothetical protein